MQVTFVASHSQKAIFMPYYERINKFLISKGYKVFAGKLFEKYDGDLIVNEDERKKWYDTAIKNIKKSEIVIVEISYPSTANVGHELTYALDLGIPVVAIHKKGRDPVFLKGITNDKLTIESYNDDNLEKVLSDSLDYSASQQDARFNFFISPKIGSYLDFVSKKKRVPRAVYLRRLIEEDMKKNKQFEE